jgi:hypothetical protein
VNGGCQQLLTASLMTRQGCRTRAAARRVVAGGSGASWGFGTRPGGALTCLGACSFVPGPWSVFPRGAEQGVLPLLKNASLMTWRVGWTREASWWARAA